MSVRRTSLALWSAGLLLAVVAAVAMAATPAGVRLPDFEQVRLANGAQVALIEKHDTPLVSIAVAVRGGALVDPADREGTAALLAEMLQKGAGQRDSAAFAAAVEGVGAQLTAMAGREAIVVGGSFLSRDTELVLGLLADMLLRPRFDEAEFARARELAIQSIAAAKDGDPSALLGDYGAAWLFGTHAYGRPVGGDPQTLQAITIEDVRRYYAAQVGGDRLIVAVVGDFDRRAMRRELERAFGGWRKASGDLPTVIAPAAVKGRRVLLVDKPGATQTYFWLGQVGALRTDPARTSQSVVNTLFGGRYTSMLNTELRIRSGLSYGASSAFTRYAEPGSFAISSFAETSKTGAALDLALATLTQLHERGLDAESLASAKNYLLGQFPTSLETNGQLASRLTDLMLYGLGRDDVDEYAVRVNAVDAGTASATISRSFPRAGDLAIVLIGDADSIRDVAGRYGPLTEMELSGARFSPALK